MRQYLSLFYVTITCYYRLVYVGGATFRRVDVFMYLGLVQGRVVVQGSYSSLCDLYVPCPLRLRIVCYRGYLSSSMVFSGRARVVRVCQGRAYLPIVAIGRVQARPGGQGGAWGYLARRERFFGVPLQVSVV